MSLPRRFLPSIASLRALEALDRLGSASAAAKDLALTQGAISRQLQALERQLGVDLIERSKKALSLTPAAQDYAAETRKALALIAQSTLRLQVAPAAGTLSLAILPTFGMRWLMPRLPDFARHHPDVTINMATRIGRFNFDTEPFDAAIHFGSPDWTDTDHLLLLSELVRPVCAPELARSHPIQTPADIAKLPLLHIQSRPTAWKDWFHAQGTAPPELVLGTIYDQFSTITQAALHGLGVALMPDYLVENDLATGRLIALSAQATEANGAYYLIWPRNRRNSPALQHLRDWLSTQAQPEDVLPR